MKTFSDLPQRTLLTPEEVALFFGVSLKTVYRWYRSGLIEGMKLRRSMRIYRDSVVGLLQKKDEGADEQ
jgi:excisionase family DNA binding protein